MIDKSQNSICIVCFANYCRSPVAEYYMNKYNGANYSFISAGIEPYPQSGMDKRSSQYIKDDDGGYLIHFPKKITKKIMQDSYQIFAMDLIILNILNTKFKKYINKIKLFNYQDRKINLDDPYQYDLDNYNKIMSNIKKISETIKF